MTTDHVGDALHVACHNGLIHQNTPLLSEKKKPDESDLHEHQIIHLMALFLNNTSIILRMQVLQTRKAYGK